MTQPPVFVRGQINFDIDGNHLEFLQRRISVFGLTSLPWGPLNPREHFGRNIEANVRFAADESAPMRINAYLLREFTSTAKYMGIRFRLDIRQTEQLTAIVEKHGFYPNDHVRQYPRIPSSFILRTFPLRALGVPVSSSVGAPAQNMQVIFDVANLSPKGILLSTESQLALAYNPEDKIQLTLEARGWFPMTIQVQATVRRILDEISPRSGNLIRYLGMEFGQIDEVNKQAFLDLLRDILKDLKRQPSD